MLSQRQNHIDTESQALWQTVLRTCPLVQQKCWLECVCVCVCVSSFLVQQKFWF